MTDKTKILIAVGGTGGHVFPGYNLLKHLAEQKYSLELVTDIRGFKYLNNVKDLDISILPSSPIITNNIFKFVYSFVIIFYSILRAIFFLIFKRPSVIFGMGGYASFPLCIAARILKIKCIIYENNLIIGKANKYLLPFANKILVSVKDVKGIPLKYQKKVFPIGNIIKKEIINISKNEKSSTDKKINILILGGSQAAKIFAEILPKIFQDCLLQGVSLKIFQQCLPTQNAQLKSFYDSINIEFEIFNFSNDLINYFSKVDLAITRSGSSMLAELTNASIPFISVPLPSSAENHQLKNAIYYKEKNFGFLIEEKELKDKLPDLIKNFYKNKSFLNKIKQCQSQFSDKNVYNNINQILKDLLNEKN